MRGSVPVLEQDLSRLTILLKANSKAEKRPGLSRFGNDCNCAAAIQGRPGSRAGQLPKVTQRSCRRGIKLNKSTEEHDRNRWALSSQGAKKEAEDPKKWGSGLFGPMWEENVLPAWELQTILSLCWRVRGWTWGSKSNSLPLGELGLALYGGPYF